MQTPTRHKNKVELVALAMGETHARIYQAMRTAIAQYETAAKNGWGPVHIMPQLDVVSSRIAGVPESDRRIKIR